MLFFHPNMFLFLWYPVFILFFIFYYFLFQLIFLKKSFLLSVLASFFSCFTYYLFVVVRSGGGFQIADVLKDAYFFKKLIRWLFLYVFPVVCQKLFGWGRKLTKRTDVYPISLFIPKEKTVQKALLKKEQGKPYSALFSFMVYVIVGVGLCYAAALMESDGFVSSFFIPWAIVYLPLLYLVYKGSWVAAVGVYVCFLADLSIKGFLYNLEGYQNLLFFVRGFILIRAGMLLAVICKVEREKRRKNHIGFESSED